MLHIRSAFGRRTSFRTSQRHPHQRRRGQVLLLLVLLMIVAALLGSTFLLFVALNLRPSQQRQPRVASRFPLKISFEEQR